MNIFTKMEALTIYSDKAACDHMASMIYSHNDVGEFSYDFTTQSGDYYAVKAWVNGTITDHKDPERGDVYFSEFEIESADILECFVLTRENEESMLVGLMQRAINELLKSKKWK